MSEPRSEITSTQHAPAAALPARRRFFKWVSYGLSAAAAVLTAIPLVGYVFTTRRRSPPWIDLGPLESFAPGQTRLVDFENPLGQPWDGIVSRSSVFVRRETGDKPQFLVLAVNCAHLGCPVSWFPESGLFMCPCHGGVYHADGERASGPPPRGLFHCAWRVQGGRIEVQAPHYPTGQDLLVAEPDARA